MSEELNTRMLAKMGELVKALEESVKLQSFYAEQLNACDGGKRRTFADADAWLARLREIGAI